MVGKNKFNGGVEIEEDYGVNLYNTFYRQYDPQRGRFSGVDCQNEESIMMSVYQFGANNPVSYNDPLGAKQVNGLGGGRNDYYGWHHMHLIIDTKENPLQNIMRDLKRHTSEVLHKSIQNNYGESRREWMLWMMEKAAKKNNRASRFQLWQPENLLSN